MSAPDFQTLYDFESQMEGAAQAILAAALASLGVPVFVTRDQSTKDTPRVEVEFSVGAAGRQRKGTGTGATYREVPNSFQGLLRARVVTTRPANHDVHGQIRGLVRYTLSATPCVLNGGTLPYLGVLEMLPSGSSPRILDEKEQDITELDYALTFCIQNDAWPA